MRIDQPLLKLPIRFCAETLAKEVRALPQSAWLEHPQGYEGNAAVPLVSPGGELSNSWAGPMAATPALEASPYTMDIMRTLDATWGRSRHMSLRPGAIVPPHVDIHYYWRTHLRIHVPVVTNPDVRFHCDGQTVNMKAGECWLLDSFYPHAVENRGNDTRIHLVMDTVGSASLADLIAEAIEAPSDGPLVAPGTVPATALDFEQVNAPEIMSPWELGAHLDYLRGWVENPEDLVRVDRHLARLHMAWAGAWARFGPNREGRGTYEAILRRAMAALQAADDPPIMMRNGWPFLDSLKRYVFGNAIFANTPQGQGRFAPVRPLREPA
jgi:hypothetical protein